MATIVEADYLQAMQDYFRDGEVRARALGNRGPIRYTEAGEVHPDILEAYDRLGFYVFENVISNTELEELRAAYHDVVDRLPTGPESRVDRAGRPAIGTEHAGPSVMWLKPLSDPYGGTDTSKGRHQVKMYEPKPAPHLPDKIPTTVLAQLQYSDAFLRLYAHPDLLRVAAAVLGDDFVPFSEALIFKKAGESPSASWHQDGMTHWDSPDWHQHSHGFNFMAQLYGSTASNGVWYITGSQTKGRADIKGMMLETGSDLLPGAVPIVCNPGDVAISNRQVIHGSFANIGPDTRITANMGFVPRASVLGVVGRPFMTDHDVCYDDDLVRERSRMIGYAIDARRRHFPDEAPYVYRPHAESGDIYHWDDAARRASFGYNLKDTIV